MESVIWCKKSIALAIDSWGSTAANCIHVPMCVVIVYHMEISKSTSAKILKNAQEFQRVSNTIGKKKKKMLFIAFS